MTYLQTATLLALTYLIFSTERHTMSTQDAIDAIVTELAKVKDEVADAQFKLTDQINELKTQLEDAKVEDIDLSGLEAIAKTLDDLNPDPEVSNETEVETTDEALDYAADDAAPVKGDGDR